MKNSKDNVVVIDYGLGNLFSIGRALRHIGANIEITDSKEKILSASRIILPGVGAFGDGMRNLREKHLIAPLKEYVSSGRLLLGICLGMQLLMSEGEEFGIHEGLDFIQGGVIPLMAQESKKYLFKVPHIGWNRLYYPKDNNAVKANADLSRQSPWHATVFEGLAEGCFMYFAHSNIVVTKVSDYCLAETRYGDNTFCSALHRENIYACQFHPEMSGEKGLEIYRQFVFGFN